MATYSEYGQRQLDIASGQQLDRREERKTAKAVEGFGEIAEVMIFTKHVNRWEFAHKVFNDIKKRDQWERRDGSFICAVGEEVEVRPVPPVPGGGFSMALAEALEVMKDQLDDEGLENPPFTVFMIEMLAGFTDS